MTESAIIMTKQSSNLEPAVRSKAYAFLEKLTADDAAPGLHIEPLHNVADPRVRTGRVDLAYRAVLFRLDAPGNRAYVVHGIWHHDEAIKRAQRARLRLNPLNGIPEIEEVEIERPERSERPRVPEPEDQPTVLGHTPAELVDGLGLKPEIAGQVARCVTEDELMRYAETLEDWQGLALIDLASGASMEAVRAQYGLTEPAERGEETNQPGERSDSDEAILDSIRNKAASQVTFTYVDKAEDLRRVIESGDFAAWRTWLHPAQRRLVEANYNGPYRLAGGAGTGKTVVLLHRARRLALAEPEARVVLTTFTTNLAEQMRTDLGTLDARVRLAHRFGDLGVQVIGIDALASAVLQSASVGELDTATATLFGQSGRDVARRTDETELWQRALGAAGSALPAELASVATIKGEYAAVVLPRRISRKEDYVRVPRPGRGIRLSRAQRLAVWAVVEAYRAHAYAEGGVDYAEAAALAALVLELRPEKPADHVLVDEGQDLGPCHLQLIRSLVAEGGNDVFLAEDSHQRIYGQRIVLSHYGLNIRGRSSRLRLNYRTTAENLTLARGILEGATWVDGEDQPEDSSGYRSLRNGPRPRLLACETLTAEYDRAADLIKSWLDELAAEKLTPETLAVLVRDRRQRDQVVAALGERGVRVRAVDRGKVPAGLPVVMTMHRSKGTEFAKVLLLGVSSKNLPARFVVQSQAPPEERDEAMLRERALLYVAASRARDELVISFSGTQSPLLPGGSRQEELGQVVRGRTGGAARRPVS